MGKEPSAFLRAKASRPESRVTMGPPVRGHAARGTSCLIWGRGWRVTGRLVAPRSVAPWSHPPLPLEAVQRSIAAHSGHGLHGHSDELAENMPIGLWSPTHSYCDGVVE